MLVRRAWRSLIAGAALLGVAACSSTPEFHTRGLVPPPAACGVNPNDIGTGAQMSPVNKGNGCQIPNPWRMSSIAGVGLINGATLNCGMVGVVGDWMSGVVQPAAQSAFGEPVTSVKVAASYSCRARNNSRGAKMSEHGFGNAIDISEFTLASGRIVAVKSGWSGSIDQQVFLREIEQEACDHFNTVLGPSSDRHHHDHFHLDLQYRKSGRGKYCR